MFLEGKMYIETQIWFFGHDGKVRDIFGWETLSRWMKRAIIRQLRNPDVARYEFRYQQMEEK
jgi:hypothetical protein